MSFFSALGRRKTEDGFRRLDYALAPDGNRNARECHPEIARRFGDLEGETGRLPPKVIFVLHRASLIEKEVLPGSSHHAPLLVVKGKRVSSRRGSGPSRSSFLLRARVCSFPSVFSSYRCFSFTREWLFSFSLFRQWPFVVAFTFCFPQPLHFFFPFSFRVDSGTVVCFYFLNFLRLSPIDEEMEL